MKQNVRITVRGEQLYQGERSVTQQELSGTLERSERGWRISYGEQEDSGLGATRTVLTVGDGRAELVRSGSVECRMVFAPGEEHLSDYRTAQGSIRLAAATTTLRHRLSEYGGVLEIRYTVALNGVVFGENLLRLRVRL